MRNDPSERAGRAGIDSERWQGYAFGMGIERVAMLRYGSMTCAGSSKTICSS